MKYSGEIYAFLFPGTVCLYCNNLGTFFFPFQKLFTSQSKAFSSSSAGEDRYLSAAVPIQAPGFVTFRSSTRVKSLYSLQIGCHKPSSYCPKRKMRHGERTLRLFCKQIISPCLIQKPHAYSQDKTTIDKEVTAISLSNKGTDRLSQFYSHPLREWPGSSLKDRPQSHYGTVSASLSQSLILKGRWIPPGPESWTKWPWSCQDGNSASSLPLLPQLVFNKMLSP